MGLLRGDLAKACCVSVGLMVVSVANACKTAVLGAGVCGEFYASLDAWAGSTPPLQNMLLIAAQSRRGREG